MIVSYQTLGLDDYWLKAGSVHVALYAVFLFLGVITIFILKVFMYFRIRTVTMFVAKR